MNRVNANGRRPRDFNGARQRDRKVLRSRLPGTQHMRPRVNGLLVAARPHLAVGDEGNYCPHGPNRQDISQVAGTQLSNLEFPTTRYGPSALLLGGQPFLVREVFPHVGEHFYKEDMNALGEYFRTGASVGGYFSPAWTHRLAASCLCTCCLKHMSTRDEPEEFIAQRFLRGHYEDFRVPPRVGEDGKSQYAFHHRSTELVRRLERANELMSAPLGESWIRLRPMVSLTHSPLHQNSHTGYALFSVQLTEQEFTVYRDRSVVYCFNDIATPLRSNSCILNRKKSTKYVSVPKYFVYPARIRDYWQYQEERRLIETSPPLLHRSLIASRSGTEGVAQEDYGRKVHFHIPSQLRLVRENTSLGKVEAVISIVREYADGGVHQCFAHQGEVFFDSYMDREKFLFPYGKCICPTCFSLLARDYLYFDSARERRTARMTTEESARAILYTYKELEQDVVKRSLHHMSFRAPYKFEALEDLMIRFQSFDGQGNPISIVTDEEIEEEKLRLQDTREEKYQQPNLLCTGISFL